MYVGIGTMEDFRRFQKGFDSVNSSDIARILSDKFSRQSQLLQQFVLLTGRRNDLIRIGPISYYHDIRRSTGRQLFSDKNLHIAAEYADPLHRPVQDEVQPVKHRYRKGVSIQQSSRN